jgi:hypothetical protein
MAEHVPPSSTRPTTPPDVMHDDLAVIEGDQQAAPGTDVATAAREGVADVAHEARRQGRLLFDDARDQLRSQADQQATQISHALHQLGGRMDALADGRTEEAGQLGEQLHDLGARTRELADRIEELGVDGVVREVQRFARRRPGAFLLTAAAVGFTAGRLGRSVADADGETQEADAPRPHGATAPPAYDPVVSEPAAPVVETAGIPVPPVAGRGDVPLPGEVPPVPGTGEVRR